MNISVITTVFNGERFIKETVQSILRQTYSNIEYIIIDDFSTDDTLNTLYSIKDPRLKIYSSPRKGRGYALNFGINKAKSKWISIIDADDVASIFKLEIQLKLLKKNKNINFLASFCSANKSNLLQKNLSYLPNIQEIPYSEFCLLNPICHSSVVFQKKLLDSVKKYSESRRSLFDFDLWIKLIERNNKFYKVEEVLVFKRLHKEQNFERKNRISYIYDASKLKFKVAKICPNKFKNYFMICLAFFYALLPISFRKKIRRNF